MFNSISAGIALLAGAAELAEPAGAVYREGYEARVNVSAGIVVGAVLGGGTAIADRKTVTVDISGVSGAGGFCLRVDTIDGRFWAQNPFRVNSAGAAPWAVSPITQKHAADLMKYADSEFVALATIPAIAGGGEACEGRADVIAPAISGDAPVLTIQLNSSQRMTRGLLRSKSDSVLISRGVCRRAKFAVAAIFDQTCEFELPSPAPTGLATLELEFDAAPFGIEKWTETVALPEQSGLAK